MGWQGKGQKRVIIFILFAVFAVSVSLITPQIITGRFDSVSEAETPSVNQDSSTGSLNAEPAGSEAKTRTIDAISAFSEVFETNVLALHSSRGSRDATTNITLADGQSVVARYDQDTGVPAFITGNITPPPAESLPETALAFLDENAEAYDFKGPAAWELDLREVEEDALGMKHVRLAQVHDGVPVFGSELAFHFTTDGKIAAINGSYHPGIDISAKPDIGGDTAVEISMEDLGLAGVSAEMERPELVILPQQGTSYVLAWKVTLASDDQPVRMVYFINGHDGSVAAKYDAIEDARNRQTYTANYGTGIPGTLMISEGGPWTGDSVVNAAHYNAGLTYDYYANTFGRDSLNDNGMTIRSTVHYRSGYNNAFWNGYQMTYGDGDGYVFSPLGNALDVVAHEMTHGVTQYTASLVYSYQSGALNESYSDVMGAMVDRDDWLMGEDVYTPSIPGDALRSLSNPAQFGQPAHMNDYVNTSSDNGGVHTNSGIPNKAAYNVAIAIGKDKMEQIWYRALTDYLTSSAQFADARDASVQAAADLYGPTSAEVIAVSNGFAAVGITGSGMPSETTARVEIDHTYRGDLVVTLGVGDPQAPEWSTVISNRQGGSADGLNMTVDIASAADHLPPSWGDRWYLEVYDAAGADTGQINEFSITDHSDTYSSTDTPVSINDYQTSFAYVPTTDETPPTVIGTDPVDGDSAVAMDSDVTATFSEDIDEDTLNGASFTLVRQDDPYGEPLPAAISYDSDTRTVSLDPDSDLGDVTDYKAVITSDVSDEAGNHLVSDYQWTFVVDPEPPVVSNVEPAGIVHSGDLAITADYSDTDSGIDMNSVQVTIDGVTLTGCTVSADNVSCGVTGLEDGDYVIGGSVSDYAGNTSPISGSFTLIDTTAPAFGNLDRVSADSPGELTVSGWAIDPDTGDPIDVHFYVNGQFSGALTADVDRPDVEAVFPGYGSNHGFNGSVAVKAATNTVCAYGINNGPGSNVLLGCKIVNAAVNPFGSLDGVTVDSTGQISVSGWAIDPDTVSASDVHIYVNSHFSGSITADSDRHDVGTVFPAYGDQHGYSGNVTATAANNTVCAYGINTGAGGNALLGCKVVNLQVHPFGSLDSVIAGSPGKLNVSGWAIDPNSSSAVDVHVYVNGKFAAVINADDQRSDIASAFPFYGALHGFYGNVDTDAESNSVCTYAINQGPGGNSLLGCKVAAAPVNPFGSLDSVVDQGNGQLKVGGWAIDPDTASPIDVHVYVNGHFRGATNANLNRTDVGRAYPAYGDEHGFSVDVSGNPGGTVVCAYGINNGAGGNVLLGCRAL